MENAIEQASQAIDTAVADGKFTKAPVTNNPEKPEGSPVVDLDKAEKFKWGGREWTPDQLKKAQMLHSDYTKKTQALSEEKKYWSNLRTDLAKVQNNPSLADEFRRVYPKEYHDYLAYAGVKEQQKAARNSNEEVDQTKGIDPKIIEDFNQMKNYIRQQEIEKHEAKIDNVFAKMSVKYPEAIEDVVLAKADVLDSKGIEITDDVWEKLWKDSHDTMLARAQSGQKKIVEAQRAANQKGKAQGPGGGVPGQAPVKMKLKDVADFAINNITNKR